MLKPTIAPILRPVVSGIKNGYKSGPSPSLSLNFVTSASLDPRITFTRASAGTRYNSAGVLEVTPVNLLTYSEQFDNSAWDKSNTTVTANAVVSPDGTITADKLVEDTANALHYAGSSPVTPSAGAVYTATGYAKAGERNWLVIVSVVGGNVTYRSFNLSTGTLGTTTDGSSTASITAVGNGWYRCSLTFTASAATAGTVRYWVESTDSKDAYTGDGTSGIYIWGAQLQTGSVATTYIPTTATSSGAPRFDYDPVTLAPKGLLIEEQRTNLLTYSEQFDNAAWTKTASTSVTANTTTAPDGTATADTITFTGSNSSIYRGQAVLTAATTYTGSVWLKTDSGAGTIVLKGAAGTGATRVSLTTTWQRFSITYAAANASDGLTIERTLAGDLGTVIAWGGQLEAGAFPTSYIPTVASQVTRAADVATMTGSNFSSWYNASEGTLFAEFIRNATPNTSQDIIAISDGTSSNTLEIYSPSSTTSVSFYVSNAGATQANIVLTNASLAGVSSKTAAAYAVNSFQQASNGVLGTQDTSGTVPTVNRLSIGSLNSSVIICGTIKRIAYYPRRLSNTELVALTS